MPPVVELGLETRRVATTLNSPYFLYVGTVEPRKNLATVLRAIRVLRDDGIDIRLVIVGKLGWHSDEIMAELRASVQAGAAEWLGYVSDEVRDSLYASARAVVVPSVYEGFGLPVLEAMARGTPCIASDTPALVEVSRGSAIHIPVFDVRAWADAMERVMSDPQLVCDLRTAGRARASHFSLANAAQALHHALDSYT